MKVNSNRENFRIQMAFIPLRPTFIRAVLRMVEKMEKESTLRRETTQSLTKMEHA